MRLLSAALFLAGMVAATEFAAAQPPAQPGQPGKDKGGFPGGFPGRGNFTPPKPGQVMPAFLQEMLKLTDAQKKDLEALQRDVDAKLDKILTDDQKKQLKEMRERGPGGFPGRPGGDKGNPPVKKKD